MSKSKTPAKKKVKEETQADAPVVTPVEEEILAVKTGILAEWSGRTRVHRGQVCPVTKVTKNTSTGAIYDHILYVRNVTNRRTGEVSPASVGKKLRRPGTGSLDVPKEVEIEE